MNLHFFFGRNSSANTIIWTDATFGSCRGAISQQNPESVRRHKLKLPLTRYEIGMGLDPIDGVHTFAAISKKNIFQFFLA